MVPALERLLQNGNGVKECLTYCQAWVLHCESSPYEGAPGRCCCLTVMYGCEVDLILGLGSQG